MKNGIKLLVGGPRNSGKSTFALSVVTRLKSQGIKAESVELDVWSNSYPAFRGEVPFDGRDKRQGLDWDWQSPLNERLDMFNRSPADVVFGDLPGKLDEVVGYVCDRAQADGAVIVCRSIQKMHLWREEFQKHGVEVKAQCLTLLGEGQPPFIAMNMDRTLRPDELGVYMFGCFLTGLLGPKCGAGYEK